MTFYETAETFASGAMTLPRHCYTSADHFALERERILYQRWIYVGRTEEISRRGDYFLARVGEETLIVTRDASGEIHAFLATPCDGANGDELHCAGGVSSLAVAEKKVRPGSQLTETVRNILSARAIDRRRRKP